ncbi:Na+/H+ antiporter subunit A [Brevibacterium album]|uniref:Na+/H+ antiporter subunit A n=1 Tax=Brevibacterium album TaxID=417948 RepID=UPI00041DF69C|nr:Na+/H+ antiporter subunit A [Brevibacterium album]
MTVLLGATFLAALASPLLFRLLGRGAFLALSLVPFAGFAYSLTLLPAVLGDGFEAPVEELRWLPALNMSLAVRMDSLAWIFSLLVTAVGGLVFVYCARYFDADEPRLARFGGVLMAFVGMMYGLVVSDELLTLFLFWEGTTVFSFLLIGQYAGRQQSRRAALQALIVTTAGGLTMFVGMILLGILYGTGSIPEILRIGFDGDPLVVVAILLMLVGAVSKSALVPFHFWLPGAMAAPTPVSAYLHAAAMVKAGIYLVLRLAPGFADMPLWREGLVALGLLTMLMGGWQALRETDLKLILAYGTVSQLGFMTTMASFGHRDVTTAALALLLGHSMFKATLFLVVGIIDHRAGTRDLRKLSGYGRAYPVVAVMGIIAAASMSGLPPTLGFIAKEAVYGTLLDHGTKLGVIVLIGVFLGSVLTVAYSARFVWGAFARKPGVEAFERTRPDSPLFLAAPALLTLVTVAGAFAAPAADGVVAAWSAHLPVDPGAAAAEAAEGPHPYYLALWHGFEPALLISALTLAAGLTLFAFRTQVGQFQATLPAGIDFRASYRASIEGLERLAAFVTSRTQRGSMPFYQGVIYVFSLGALGIALLSNDTWPGSLEFADSPLQVFVAIIMIIASVAATRIDKRFAAVVIVGVTGYAMVVFFALQGSPDLALTQILVESIVLVVFVFVLRRLPARIGKQEGRLNPALRAVIAVVFGLLMVVVALVALGARGHSPISELFPALAYEGGHGSNIVNVTLVDIRGWDTMGELSVVIACAIGVASLVFVSGHGEAIQRIPEAPTGRRRFGEPVFEPVMARRVGEPADPEAAAHLQKEHESPEERRNSWLLAGRTLAPHNRSIVLEVAVRLMFHAFLVFSIYLLFAGHNLPGGGFAGGLVAGLAFVIRYLAGGRYEYAEAVRLQPGPVMGVGMVLAAGTAVAGYLWSDAALQSFYVSTELPLLGYVSFGSSTIFDIGVYLVVIALMVGVVRSLGVEVDIQQMRDEDRIAERLPDAQDTERDRRIRALMGRDHLDVDGSSAGGRL